MPSEKGKTEKKLHATIKADKRTFAGNASRPKREEVPPAKVDSIPRVDETEHGLRRGVPN
jgi:hypothetical protein